jgi:hypothetical protein
LISNTLDEELGAIGLEEQFGALNGLDGELSIELRAFSPK